MLAQLIYSFIAYLLVNTYMYVYIIYIYVYIYIFIQSFIHSFIHCTCLWPSNQTHREGSFHLDRAAGVTNGYLIRQRRWLWALSDTSKPSTVSGGFLKWDPYHTSHGSPFAYWNPGLWGFPNGDSPPPKGSSPTAESDCGMVGRWENRKPRYFMRKTMAFHWSTHPSAGSRMTWPCATMTCPSWRTTMRLPADREKEGWEKGERAIGWTIGCSSSTLGRPYFNPFLVGGLVAMFYFPIYWESSSQLTFIFFRGVQTTNQFLCFFAMEKNHNQQWHSTKKIHVDCQRLTMCHGMGETSACSGPTRLRLVTLKQKARLI